MAGNDINIRIGAKLDGLQRDIKKAQGSLTRFANFAESTGRDLSTRLTLPIVALGGAAVKTFAEFDRIEKGLQVFAGSSEAASAQFKRINDIVNDTRTTLDLKTAAKGAQRLQAMGLNANDAENAIKQFGIVATASGSSVDEVGNALRQFGQILAKGKAEQEDFNSLFDNLGQLSSVIQDKFGVKTAEDLRALGISMDDFVLGTVDAIEKNERLQNIQGGLAKSFESFGNAIQVGIKPLGEAIAKALNLEENLKKLADFVTRTSEAFADLPKDLQRFIVLAAAAAAALGPLLLGLGAVSNAGLLFSTGLSTITRTFGLLVGGPLKKAVGLFKGLGLLFTGGIGRSILFTKVLGGLTAAFSSVLLPIAALGAAFVAGYTRSETFRNIIGQLADVIKRVVVGVFSLFGQSVSSISEAVLKLSGFLAALLGSIVEVATGFLNFLAGIGAGIKALASGDVFGALRSVKKGFDDLFDVSPVENFKKVYDEVVNGTSKPLFGGGGFNFGGGGDPDPTKPKGDGDKGAEAFSIYSDVSEKIISDLTRVSTQAQLTGTSLREMAETSGLQFELGRSVEELGLKIQAAPSFLSSGAEALKAYSDEITLAAEKNSVLGDSFNLIEEKLNITKAALTAAVEQFGANSAEVGYLKEQFTALGVELELFNAQQQRMATFGNVIQEIGNEIESLAERGALSLKNFASAALDAIKRVIGAVIKEGVALAIRNALATSVFAGPASVGIAAGAGAAASGLFQALINRIKPPGLAAGGIIPPGFEGDRFPAMLNSGEAVIPLDKLFRVLGNGGGPTEFVVRGADLVAVMGRANYNNNRTGF